MMHLIQEPFGKNAHHIARDSTICLEVLTMTASEQPGISKLSLAPSEQCFSQNVTLSFHPNSRLLASVTDNRNRHVKTYSNKPMSQSICLLFYWKDEATSESS